MSWSWERMRGGAGCLFGIGWGSWPNGRTFGPRCGARRHLYALGITPGEALLAKLLATGVVQCVTAAALWSLVRSRPALWDALGSGAIPTVTGLAAGGLLVWSMALLSRSWPGVGTGWAIGGFLAYTIALRNIPLLSRYGNVFGIVGSGGGGAGVVSVAASWMTAGVLILVNLGLAWLGQRRPVT